MAGELGRGGGMMCWPGGYGPGGKLGFGVVALGIVGAGVEDDIFKKRWVGNGQVLRLRELNNSESSRWVESCCGI